MKETIYDSVEMHPLFRKKKRSLAWCGLCRESIQRYNVELTKLTGRSLNFVLKLESFHNSPLYFLLY